MVGVAALKQCCLNHREHSVIETLEKRCKMDVRGEGAFRLPVMTSLPKLYSFSSRSVAK